MAFGDQLEVDKEPIDFNIGFISSVGNCRNSQNSPINQVADVTITPVLAARKRDKGEKLYLVFRENWLKPAHSADEVTKGTERFLYDRFFGKKGGKGIIHQLLGPDALSDLNIRVTEGGLSSVEFVEFLNTYLTNQVRGYTLEQGKDKEKVTDPETGEASTIRFRTEFKSVGKLFQADEVPSIEKSAQKAYDRSVDESAAQGCEVKPSMRVFWEVVEGSNPFQTAMEELSAA